VDLVTQHREAARELYRRRVRMLKTGTADSASLQKTERRMRVAIAGAIPGQGKEQKPRDAAAGFVAYATRIVNEKDETNRYATYKNALVELEEGGHVAEGVFDALMLYPPDNLDWMLTQYREQPKLRVHLFRLWRAQSVALPTGLINQADVQSQDVALQQSALHFAANSPHYGKEMFSAYYRDQRTAHTGERITETALAPAIWGGLVRGDDEAYIALRSVVEHASDLAVRHDLLRLLALAGREEDLPILLSYAERDPQRGYPLLALYGRPGVVPAILQGLESANSLQAAYAAWLMLTNLPLSLRPRLMLVDEHEETDPYEAVEAEMEMIPDATLARKWWETQQPHWPPDHRRFSGVDLTRENLSQAITRRIGAAADDLTALLALDLRRPLGLGSGWECQRQEKLRQLLAGQPTAILRQTQVH
jgi:hypothetical protein